MNTTQRYGGQAQVLVLWALGLVSVAIGTLTVESVHELRLGRMPLAVLQRRAIAQAGVQQAIALLTRDDPALDHLGESWATGKEGESQFLQDIAVGDGFFSIGVIEGETWRAGLIDEERKVNLNVATSDDLRRLIDLVKTEDLNAQAFATAIIDWREKTDPEGPACQDATPPCHNGPFETVDELRLVSGMTPELFAALEPYVTVYGSGSVNVNTASAIVLNALGCPGETLVQQRAGTPFTSPPATCSRTAVTSTAFLVPVEARLSSISGQSRINAVINRAGKILAWFPR